MILRLFFLLGLFFLPLIFWPAAPIPYEIPRVWFFCRWVEFLGIAGLLGAPFVLKRKQIDFWPTIFVSLFILIALFSSLLGVDFGKSFWGNPYRDDGLLTLFHLGGLFFFVLLFWEKSWRVPTARAIGLGSLLVGLWAVFLGICVYILNDQTITLWSDGFGVSFGNPNFLAGYLVVTLPFLAYLAASSFTKQKIFWSLGLLSQIAAIFLTLSWAGIAGVFLFGTVWLILNTQKPITRYLMPVFSGAFLLAVIFLGWQSNKQTLFEGRERIFTKGILGFWQRPVLGWGWTNFDYAFESVSWPLPVMHDVYVDKAHAQLLEVLVTTGIIGILVYLTLAGKVVVNLLKALGSSQNPAWSKTLFLALILFLFHSQTNVISIGEEAIFWLIVGIVGGENKP